MRPDRAAWRGRTPNCLLLLCCRAFAAMPLPNNRLRPLSVLVSPSCELVWRLCEMPLRAHVRAFLDPRLRCCELIARACSCPPLCPATPLMLRYGYVRCSSHVRRQAVPYCTEMLMQLCIAPKRHSPNWLAITPAELEDLAALLQRLLEALYIGAADPSYDLNWCVH